MKHSRNDDSPLCLDYFVDYSIGKAFWVTPANVLAGLPTVMQQRVSGEFVEDIEELFDEAIAETFAAAVVPGSNPYNVTLCFRS